MKIYLPDYCLRPPLKQSVGAFRETLKRQLLERDNVCVGCGFPLQWGHIHMHESIISRNDAKGLQKKFRGQIFTEFNCVLLCDNCNLGLSGKNAPNRIDMFWLQYERYGDDLVKWLATLPFKVHPMRGILEQFEWLELWLIERK